MSVKAELKVVLRANEVEVAESDDPVLWQRVFAAISSGNPESFSSSQQPAPTPAPVVFQAPAAVDPADPSARFAQLVGVDVALIVGACSPSSSAPFLSLNQFCWEAMKKALPERGTKALAPAQAPATLLALWFQILGNGAPTQAQAQSVLGTIGQRDANLNRSISRAEWLQTRSGGGFVINPAEMSTATMIAKCFASKDWSEYLKVSD